MPSVNYYELFAFFYSFVILLFLHLANPVLAVLISIFYFVSLFIFLRPKYFFHPNNIVFLFYFLYYCVPAAIVGYYKFNGISSTLDWNALPDWYSMSMTTYTDAALLYFILYFSFHFLCKLESESLTLINNKKTVSVGFILFTGLFVFLLGLYYISVTGGLFLWVYDYKYTFLLGREGNGVIGFILVYSSYFLAYMLGLFFLGRKIYLSLFFFVCIFSILIFSAFLLGFKSRVFEYAILVSMPLLFKRRISFKVTLIVGGLFFVFLYIATVLRTGGAYDGLILFLEYSVYYFNVFPLHDLVVHDFDYSLFQTFHYSFVKIGGFFGLWSNEDFDISIFLTKIYYPEDWADARATQQWPIVSNLRVNYLGFVLGWIPLFFYVSIVSFLYRRFFNGDLALGFIFGLEFLRIFTVLRGVILPWQWPVYFVFYILGYFLIKYYLRVYSTGQFFNK